MSQCKKRYPTFPLLLVILDSINPWVGCCPLPLSSVTVWPLTGCSSHIDKTGNKTNSCPSPSQDYTRSNISTTIVPNYLGFEMVHNTCGMHTIKLDLFGIVANKMRCVWVFPCCHYNCNVNILLFSSLCCYMVVFSFAQKL